MSTQPQGLALCADSSVNFGNLKTDKSIFFESFPTVQPL